MRENNTHRVPVTYFNTRELFTIATLACMGAAMSVVIGHATQAMRSVGIPGQALAGLHVLWLILSALLIPRPGAASATGIMKGSIELLLGGPHGLIVLLISGVAGVLVDIVVWLSPKRLLYGAILFAGALSAGSNVILFRYLMSLQKSNQAWLQWALATWTLIAAISGVVAGSLLAFALIKPLRRAGVITNTLGDIKQ